MKLHTAFFRAVEWRLIATVITAIIAYLMTGSFKFVLAITSLEAGAKTIVQAIWLRYR